MDSGKLDPTTYWIVGLDKWDDIYMVLNMLELL